MDTIIPWLTEHGLSLLTWSAIVLVGVAGLLVLICGLVWATGGIYRMMKVVAQCRLAHLVEANKVHVVLTERESKRRSQSDGVLRDKVQQFSDQLAEARAKEADLRRTEEDLRRLMASQDEVLGHRAQQIEALEKALVEKESNHAAAEAAYQLLAAEREVEVSALKEEMGREKEANEHLTRELQGTQMAATMLDKQHKAQQRSLEMANATVTDLNAKRDILQEQLRSAHAQLATVREMAGYTPLSAA